MLCTESASEGLNLQTCGILLNYDMPWNPMRVEQRIGRIDRIGQAFSTVIIHNFYYDGTVEAKVYQRLRDRIHAFSSVVGSLQPILAKVPTIIERATMSADPQEENVIFSDFDHDLAASPLQVTLDDMVQMDVEADIASIREAQGDFQERLYPLASIKSEYLCFLVGTIIAGNHPTHFTHFLGKS